MSNIRTNLNYATAGEKILILTEAKNLGLYIDMNIRMGYTVNLPLYTINDSKGKSFIVRRTGAASFFSWHKEILTNLT